MELSPTLVSRLGVLEKHVLDPEVTEVLVAAPNTVWVTRGSRTERLQVRLDDGAIRSLAVRLGRELAGKGARSTRSGLISTELFVSLVGAPRAERCPVIRFVRRTLPKRTLNELAVAGVVDRESEMRLLQACRNRRTIVISGHPGSGRTELLAALARVWKQERRVAVLDVADGRLSAAEIGQITLEPSVGAQGAGLVGADVIVADDPSPALWAQLLGFGRPFLATVEAVDAQAALDRIVALCLKEQPDTSQAAGMALVESAVGLVVEMERANGRILVRAISEPQRADGALSVRPPTRPPPSQGTPMSRLPDMPPRPSKEASDLRSVASLSNKEPTPSFVMDAFGFETSDISEIRAENLMSASFVGRLPEPIADESAAARSAETKAIRRSASERVPTLVGRKDSGEIETSVSPQQKLDAMIVASLGEDDTHPPDEQTMHAEAGEMALEPFEDKIFTAPSSGGIGGWPNPPSEVTKTPVLLDDERDDTEDKGFTNERTPYSPFAEQQKKDSLTDEEIEGMLSDLEEVVNLDNDDGPKAKRRTRKAR